MAHGGAEFYGVAVNHDLNWIQICSTEIFEIIVALQPDLLLGVVTVVMAVLGGVVSAHAPTNIKHKILYICGFVALGIFSFVLVFQVSRATARSEFDRQNALNEIQQKTDRISQLQEKNNALQQRFVQMGTATASLVRENIRTYTGGDSFCVLDFMYQFGSPAPILLHQGKYTLYDVNVRVTDVSKMLKRTKQNLPIDISGDRYAQLQEFQPGRAWVDGSFKVPFSEQEAQDFNIFFAARNGSWVEKLRLRKVGDHWVQAIQVLFGNKSKPVYELVSKEYPRQPDGSMDWGK